MQELNAPFTAEEIKSISEDQQLSQSAESIANYINDIMDDMYKNRPNFRNCRCTYNIE